MSEEILWKDRPSQILNIWKFFFALLLAVNLRDTLRKRVEYWRDRKRVREVDFEEGGDMEGDEGLFDD